MRLNALKISAHVNIVLSVVFIVFAVITSQNTSMGFLTDKMSLSLLSVFCLFALILVALFALETADLRRKGRLISVFGAGEKNKKALSTVLVGGFLASVLTFAFSVAFIVLVLVSEAIGPDEIMNSLKTVYSLVFLSLTDIFLSVIALFTVRKIERFEEQLLPAAEDK
ncbi:MAG: hypothetical protein IKM53_02035 [Clostridia bacterium]|nr:hypothetical protein [Clostridia bacterium]